MSGFRLPPEQDLQQLNALADDELDAEARRTLTQRIETEPALRAALDTITASRDVVKRLPIPAVSDEFRHRMGDLADAMAGAPAADTDAPAGRKATSPGWSSGWERLAAAVLISAFLASGTTYLLTGAPSAVSMDELVASSHRRSLLAASPVDIATSDRHTVKPWLDARIGLSPPATDLAPAGYKLLGGRVEVLAGRTVPALVYRHNEHIITLIAEPGSKAGTDTRGTDPRRYGADGYNMVHWSDNGFNFWAVSDLEPAELDSFVADYIAASSAGPPAK